MRRSLETKDISASTGPLIEISGKQQRCGYDVDADHSHASTGPLIEISGKLNVWLTWAVRTGFNGAADRDQRKAIPACAAIARVRPASTGPLIEISGKL